VRVNVYQIPALNTRGGSTNVVEKTIVEMNGDITKSVNETADSRKLMDGTWLRDQVATPAVNATTEAGRLSSLSILNLTISSATVKSGAAAATISISIET
jgi:hypothetical protein